MWKILKDIAKKNKRQLFLTFLLVAMENLMAILYPLFAKINDKLYSKLNNRLENEVYLIEKIK